MRVKREFSFDEVRDAEEIIKNGFPNGIINYGKMNLVGKYFRDNFGYGAIRLERELISFCKSQDINFNPITNADMIRRWVKSAMEYELRKIDSVMITMSEIKFFESLSNERDRKILFMTLVFAKALKMRSTRRKKVVLKTSDNYYINFDNFIDVIRLTKISRLNEATLADTFFNYKNIITVYYPQKKLIRLDYADKQQMEGIVINLNNPLDQYEAIFQKRKEVVLVNYCRNCGKAFEKTGSRQLYCPDCSKKRIKDKQKVRMKLRRLNEKMRNI